MENIRRQLNPQVLVNSELTPEAVQILFKTATSTENPEIFGHGLMNLRKALGIK